MNVLAGIQAHAGDGETIKANGDWWNNSGADIIMLEGEDSPVSCWPSNVWLKITHPIRPGKSLGYGLRPTLSVDSICSLTKLASACAYETILWTEADSIFLGQVPERFDRKAFNAVIAGHCPPEWNCGNGMFLHPPFLMTVQVAKRWCTCAKSISTEQGNGAPDVFVPIVAKAANIPVVPIRGTYSCNGLDMRALSKLTEARRAARVGCWHIHGVKRQDQQDYILDKTDVMPADTLNQ